MEGEGGEWRWEVPECGGEHSRREAYAEGFVLQHVLKGLKDIILCRGGIPCANVCVCVCVCVGVARRAGRDPEPRFKARSPALSDSKTPTLSHT